MKKQYSKINEGSAEETLLGNLFNYYVEKYSDKSVSLVETHFLIAVGSLIEKGEISENVVKTFLEEYGIEGEIPKNKKASSTSSYGDGCGRSYTRSSC